MRQLITRIDDKLHARLKERAAAEGHSLNTLVADVLASAVGEADTQRAVRERARARGMLRVPPRPERVPTMDEVWRPTAGPVRRSVTPSPPSEPPGEPAVRRHQRLDTRLL